MSQKLILVDTGRADNQEIYINAYNQISTDDAELEVKPSDIMMSPTAHIRRTFRERTFSKLGKGSIRGSIFALCASAIGSGVLSLPYILKLNGWALGVAFICLGALASLISLRMLASIACEQKLPNFSKICLRAGGKSLDQLMSWSVILFMFGSCITYFIILTSLIQYVCVQLNVSEDTVDSMEFRAMVSAPLALIIFLLSMKRDMSAFRYVSLFSIAALIYTAIVLTVELPAYYSEFSPLNNVPPAYWDWNMLTGCSMTFFAF